MKVKTEAILTCPKCGKKQEAKVHYYGKPRSNYKRETCFHRRRTEVQLRQALEKAKKAA